MAWRVAIDVGGTFTDLLARNAESGERMHIKVLSTPAEPHQAVLDALDQFTAQAPGAEITSIAHATTLGSNMLLGRQNLGLPKIALITTEGFRDIIEIARQNRPELYNFFFDKPRSLVPRNLRFTVAERVDHTGEVIEPLDESQVRAVAAQCRSLGVSAVGVCFLHSYANSAHEQRVKALLAEAAPGIPVVLSSEVNPEYREYERTATTVANALLMPVLVAHFESLESRFSILSPTPDSRLPAPQFLIMTSAGGLMAADHASRVPAATLESGPAAGAVAAASLAHALNLPKLLTLDMGGTTAKAARVINGSPQLTYEFEVGGKVHAGRFLKGSGYPVRYPAIDLAEVSAGGGTLIQRNVAGQIEVGPLSAGANPGPICYDRGGSEPTITDANLVLGRLHPDHFLGGAMRLNAEKASASLDVESASDAIRLVNSQMAKALAIVSSERGDNPADFALVAFGGAGPMHACELADRLEIRQVIFPSHPGLFSAAGLHCASQQVHLQASCLCSLDEADAVEVETQFKKLEAEAKTRLPQCQLQRNVDARYRGQSY
ncbi:MAG: hydantoinase/oxoprolinase family protein, partial [bacterium]